MKHWPRWLAAVFLLLVLWFWLRPPTHQSVDTALPLPDEAAATPTLTAPAPNFVDVTEAASIDFVRNNGARGERLLPETMGGGVAFLDFDNDGWSDLLFVDGGDWPDPADRQPPKHGLYRNLGNGSFENVTATAGFTADMHGMGMAIGDYDADGWVDVLLTGIGGTRLLRNSAGRFADVTSSAGLGTYPNDWSVGAVFFDADGDGDLDLFVANYVNWSRDIDLAVDYRLAGLGRAYGPPMNFEGSHNRLYLQDEPGQFREVDQSSGLHPVNPHSGAAIGKALGVLAMDANEDGRVDLLVVNDTVRNFLFLNEGEGRFTEAAAEWGLAYDRDGAATGAMGVDSGWFGPEQRRGILIGNFANEMSSFYMEQEVPGLYSDDAIISGLGASSRQALTFGVLVFDYDLDGWQDLLQTNGHIESEISTVQASQRHAQAGQLYWNCHSACGYGFLEVGNQQLGDLARPVVGRGSAYADFDHDGDLDIAIAVVAGRPMLLRNDQALGNDYIALRLRGLGRNRDALGAQLWLHTAAGVQRREISNSRGYLSQVEPIAHFGLGSAADIQRLEIRWPNGQLQTVPATDLSMGQTNEIFQVASATNQPDSAKEP